MDNPRDPAWCDYCQNTGTVECLCGGDLCVCGQNEMNCPVCGGMGDEDCGDDCERCNGTGRLTVRTSFPMAYVCAGEPPEYAQWAETDIGRLFVRFECALGRAWITDSTSNSDARMKRDWDAANKARDELVTEIKLLQARVAKTDTPPPGNG